MNLYAKLIVSLAFFSGVAAGLLSYTFGVTAPIIAERELEDGRKALREVFFLHKKDGALTLAASEMAPGVTALYRPDGSGEPLYYAVAGEGAGYNSSVPVTLMVGFTGPGDSADKLLQGYAAPGQSPPASDGERFVVGFSVIKSEETPGLGEKVKDVRPPFTWAQFFSGNRPPDNPDKATGFQRQFRGKSASALKLKKDGGALDAITASTITSRGVLAAIRNAEEKLSGTLSAKPR